MKKACATKFLVALLGVICTVSAFAQTGPQGLNLQGRIVRPDGQPVENNVVDFKVQLLDPVDGCVLYEETHVQNLANSDGIFAIRVGTGSRSGSSFKDTSSLSQIFDNNSGTMSGLT